MPAWRLESVRLGPDSLNPAWPFDHENPRGVPAQISRALAGDELDAAARKWPMQNRDAGTAPRRRHRHMRRDVRAVQECVLEIGDRVVARVALGRQQHQHRRRLFDDVIGERARHQRCVTDPCPFHDADALNLRIADRPRDLPHVWRQLDRAGLGGEPLRQMDVILDPSIERDTFRDDAYHGALFPEPLGG
jgi:hypothetical protein